MESERIRVIVVDDDPATARLLADLSEFGIVLCGLARSPSEAIDMIASRRPDVALVDLALDRSDDLPLIRSVRAEYPCVGILVYTHRPESCYAERALHAGALGFISKTASTRELRRALRTVSSGGAHFSTRTITRLMTEMAQHRPLEPLLDLTRRERQVLDMLSEGLDAAAIACHLGLNRKTVEIYKRRMMDKLGLTSASELSDFIQEQLDRGRKTPFENFQRA